MEKETPKAKFSDSKVDMKEMFSETTEQDNKTADVSVFSKIYFYLFII